MPRCRARGGSACAWLRKASERTQQRDVTAWSSQLTLARVAAQALQATRAGQSLMSTDGGFMQRLQVSLHFAATVLSSYLQRHAVIMAELGSESAEDSPNAGVRRKRVHRPSESTQSSIIVVVEVQLCSSGRQLCTCHQEERASFHAWRLQLTTASRRFRSGTTNKARPTVTSA